MTLFLLWRMCVWTIKQVTWNIEMQTSQMAWKIKTIWYCFCLIGNICISDLPTISGISRRDNVERRIKFKEGKLPRERRRSCGSIARKTSFKKCFHLRANFLFFFFFFFFFALYFYAFFAPHDRCAERSSDRLPLRAKACPPGRRGITSGERNQALSLRTSLRLNSPSQETPRGQQGPFCPIPYGEKKCAQRRPNRRCNARLRIKNHKQINYLNKLWTDYGRVNLEINYLHKFSCHFFKSHLLYVYIFIVCIN